jgi:hypothetical protein
MAPGKREPKKREPGKREPGKREPGKRDPVKLEPKESESSAWTAEKNSHRTVNFLLEQKDAE